MIYGGENRVGLHCEAKELASREQGFKGIVDGFYTLLSWRLYHVVKLLDLEISLGSPVSMARRLI